VDIYCIGNSQIKNKKEMKISNFYCCFLINSVTRASPTPPPVPASPAPAHPPVLGHSPAPPVPASPAPDPAPPAPHE
jgi:hypothetical protein